MGHSSTMWFRSSSLYVLQIEHISSFCIVCFVSFFDTCIRLADNLTISWVTVVFCTLNIFPLLLDYAFLVSCILHRVRSFPLFFYFSFISLLLLFIMFCSIRSLTNPVSFFFFYYLSEFYVPRVSKYSCIKNCQLPIARITKKLTSQNIDSRHRYSFVTYRNCFGNSIPLLSFETTSRPINQRSRLDAVRLKSRRKSTHSLSPFPTLFLLPKRLR